MRPEADTAIVASYTDRFSADVAAACLTDHGIDCTVRADPAHRVAPHLVTLRGFYVVVREEDLDDASVALGLDEIDPEAEELDRAYFHVPFSQRPRWMRWLGFGAAVGVLGPLVLTVGRLVASMLERLLPT